MTRARFFAAPPIGVDIGPRWIAAAQLASHGTDPLRVRAAACVARVGRGRADGAELARLAEVLDRRGFRGCGVVVAAPEEMLITAALELPPLSSGAPVLQLAAGELARTHKRDPQSLETALWEVPRPDGQPDSGRYMAAALPHEDGRALLNAFRAAGLHVRAIDTRAWALARACAGRIGALPGAILDLAESTATLVLVQGGVVAYQRAVADAGLENLRARLADDLELSPEVLGFVLGDTRAAPTHLPEGAAPIIDDYVQTIAAEARAAFEYITRRAAGVAINRLLVLGGGARVRTVPELLGEALGIATEVVTPAAVAECPTDMAQVCQDPRLTAALGLAAHHEGSDARCAA